MIDLISKFFNILGFFVFATLAGVTIFALSPIKYEDYQQYSNKSAGNVAGITNNISDNIKINKNSIRSYTMQSTDLSISLATREKLEQSKIITILDNSEIYEICISSDSKIDVFLNDEELSKSVYKNECPGGLFILDNFSKNTDISFTKSDNENFIITLSKTP